MALSSLVEQLLAELTEATLGCRSARIRLAVNADEYQLIRAYCFARDGRFYARVRNIPLVIDEHPEKPPFYMELVEETVADG